MGEFEVRGVEGLEQLGKRFQQAGNKDLRKELAAGIRKGNKATIAKIREHALEVLPKAGGLAQIVSKSAISTRTRLTGKDVYVRIQGTGAHNIRGMNAGRLSHPVFGNRGNWQRQSITPGWFNKPIEADAPRIRRDIDESMRRVAKKIEKGHS